MTRMPEPVGHDGYIFAEQDDYAYAGHDSYVQVYHDNFSKPGKKKRMTSGHPLQYSFNVISRYSGRSMKQTAAKAAPAIGPQIGTQLYHQPLLPLPLIGRIA